MKNQMEIKPGDIVTLKSGGPKMTVEAFYKPDTTKFDCAWFKGAEKISGTFSVVALVKASVKKIT